MIEYSRTNTIVSIFSLELIENYSESYSVYKKDLANNFLLDNITSYKDFGEYQCQENGIPKYDAFCSNEMVEKHYNGCSRNKLAKEYCDNEKFENNCYMKIPYNSGNCLDI